MKPQTLAQLMSGHAIHIPTVYYRALKDLRAAYLLSFFTNQFASRRPDLGETYLDDEHWLVGTTENIRTLTGLTEAEFRSSVGLLKSIAILDTQVRVFGDGPVTHYRVNWKALWETIEEDA